MAGSVKSERMFPIFEGDDIPWSVIEPHEEQAKANHSGQSLDRLAERGGLSPNEALHVLYGLGWFADRRLASLPYAQAAAELRDVVAERQMREESNRP